MGLLKTLVLFAISLMAGSNSGYAAFPGSNKDQEKLSIYELPPFERACRCIKFYEGFHKPEHYPFIGYGHNVQPEENLDSYLTEKQADSLLRSDLLRLCRLFRHTKSDSLILTVISYNIGPYKILGNSKYPKSTLLKMLENGERNIYNVYTSYCHWEGRKIASIRRRRIVELKLLYTP